MVLHDNKWDRKQNRDRIRKLKAKGKGDVPKPGSRADQEEKRKKEGDKLRGGVSGDSEEEDDDDDDDDGEEPSGAEGELKEAGESREPYSRRKLQSNAWRYEEEEPEFPVDGNNEPSAPPEPEPDYVALTRERQSQIKNPFQEKVRAGILDEAFLRESQWKHKKGQDDVVAPKGKMVKVDKSEFVDINDKIAKRNNVEAFRARFAKRKARVPRGGVSEVDEVDDGLGGGDLDAFLQELKLDDTAGTGGNESRPPASQEISPALGTEKGFGDEWLDEMISGR